MFYIPRISSLRIISYIHGVKPLIEGSILCKLQVILITHVALYVSLCIPYLRRPSSGHKWMLYVYDG